MINLRYYNNDFIVKSCLKYNKMDINLNEIWFLLINFRDIIICIL